MMLNKKRLDIFLLIVSPIISTLLSLAFKTNFLTSTFFFSGLPALYLSFRNPKLILRTLIFALLFSLLGGLFFDHLAVLDNSWRVPITVFSFRIFSTVPVEDVIWAFLLVYLNVMFYEHFFDPTKHNLVGKRMKYFAYIFIPLFIIFLILIFTNSPLLKIEYFYLKGGIILVLLPIVFFLAKYPKYLLKFFLVGMYFFYSGLLQELTSLQSNYWYFPGKNFIGWLTIFGFTLPYEEFFFWLILFAVCVLCYFEFFDDEKVG